MGECIKETTLVTDNSSIECEELISTKCIVHEESLPGLLLAGGSGLDSILSKIQTNLTILNRQKVVNMDFTNETSLTIIHNKGYFPLIQFKTIVDSDWTVTHTNTNQFTITFVSATSDTIIYK